MTVIHRWPETKAFDGSTIPSRDEPYTFEVSGWNSVEEMQTELMQRFSHRNPVLIESGVQYQDEFFTQIVTLHE